MYIEWRYLNDQSYDFTYLDIWLRRESSPWLIAASFHELLGFDVSENPRNPQIGTNQYGRVVSIAANVRIEHV